MYARITGTEAFTSKSVSDSHGELDGLFGSVEGFRIKGVSSSGKDSKTEGEIFEEGGCWEAILMVGVLTGLQKCN